MRARRSAKKPLETSPDTSFLMAKVRHEGSNPERVVRRLLRSQGLRFFTNGKDLPGSPDIYRPDAKRAVFVHGCFWHRHQGCYAATTPKRNRGFWLNKFETNVSRDQRKRRHLRKLGYSVMTIWECQLKSPVKLSRVQERLAHFFRGVN